MSIHWKIMLDERLVQSRLELQQGQLIGAVLHRYQQMWWQTRDVASGFIALSTDPLDIRMLLIRERAVWQDRRLSRRHPSVWLGPTRRCQWSDG